MWLALHLCLRVCDWMQVASAKVEAAVKLLLLNGCQSVVLAGHSMGAAICCETARRWETRGVARPLAA